MEEDRIWKLIAKKLAGEATEDELVESENLIKANPELHFTIETFYKLWNAASVEQTEKGNANKLLERIRKQSSHHELNSGQRKVRPHLLKRNYVQKQF